MCIHWSLRKQKCRLKSTTTNGWWHFGQSEQRKSSVLFPIQSEKSPDSGFFTCDPTKKCIMPSSRERHKGRIGRGHDLRLVYIRLCKHRKKVFYCFYKITLPRKKTQNSLYGKILSTKSCTRNQLLFCKKMLCKIRIFLA